ncbi:MAG: GntR family transcriptional regulator, partial [Pikeienuella sp.]
LHGADGRLQHSRSEPLSFATVSATAEDAARLAVATGEPLYRYHRLRVVGERPVMHDICLFSCERFPGFPSRLKDVPELLYHHLADEYGVRTSAVREEITAELASEEDIRLLKLTPPAAVLRIQDVSYDNASIPLIASLHVTTTEGQKYVNEIV